ncbi:hypothetical protein BV898_13078 [Hypsibius exemplaris]|uniref:Uncharacterized protein n=1 Tax=Hypsibius exemplaris TaxID=2072580 RepID=A0A1W0WBT9_HYPEX|nr:hypothetical protein BV898_13078 [Hypsibius exemplaris]
MPSSVTFGLIGLLFLFFGGSVRAFGVAFLPSTLNVPCGTAVSVPIGNLTIQRAFFPITWTSLIPVSADPSDLTIYIGIDGSTGVISRNTVYPPTFTQQVYKIDGIDASGAKNLVSAYMIVKFPICGSG